VSLTNPVIVTGYRTRLARQSVGWETGEVAFAKEVLVGLEIVVGFLVAWAAGKAKRVAKRADGVVDEVLPWRNFGSK
jgi:hypothetical protein